MSANQNVDAISITLDFYGLGATGDSSSEGDKGE
jgi:hypothetical protein